MRAPRHVLVPLDGSAFAESALPLALDLARRAGARVSLVTVYTPTLPVGSGEAIPALDPGFESEQRADVRAYHDLLRRRLGAEGAGVPELETVLLDGPVAEMLAAYVEACGADLVALTSHGRGGASRFWLGSVTDALVRRLDVPALVVRPGGGPTPAAAAFRRVLVPVDGSPESALGAEAAVAVAGTRDVEYTVLRVVTPGPHRFPGLAATARAESEAVDQRERALRDVAAVERRLRDHGADARGDVRAHRSAAAAIAECAAEIRADLIALATHGRGPVGRLLFGGVTDKVLRIAPAPVLVLHVGERRGASPDASPGASPDAAAVASAAGSPVGAPGAPRAPRPVGA